MIALDRPIDIFLAIPCYCPTAPQWERLAQWIDSVRSFEQSRAHRYSVCVIDDGSPTWTEPDASVRCRFDLLRQPINCGKGSVLRKAAALMPSGTDVFAFTDFDVPYSAETLIGMVNAVSFGADVCLGRRGTFERAARKSHNNGWRYLGHRLFKFMVRLLIVGGVRDSQCGIKTFHAEALREIARKSQINGFAFDIEWIYIALVHELCIRYWPVEVQTSHEDSNVRRFFTFTLLQDFLILLAGIVRRRYVSSNLRNIADSRREQISAATDEGIQRMHAAIGKRR